MPLFDPTAPLSEEPAALYRCRELVSQCSATIALFEVANAAAAKLLIFPGPAAPPLDGQAFTVSELQNQLAWGQLYPHEEESLLVSRSLAVGAVSEKAGLFRLHLRRQVREAEYNATDGRWDTYMYFLDRTTRIAEQLVEAADLNLAVSQVKRLHGPLFNHQDDWPTQGIVLWVDFLVAWGGSERAE